ncbi:adenosylcobinamide-phosphate synthase CbiB [uncultured Pelagimonas sp.]|uniref:adenosylcobinamide-phosphate synthase CbiB n=1 Tax=uncultured Pelagimonas sp. TaxID=1618102 RepID=UPI002617B524|nr:adenosylcobinamide-phosphate synthase CbiB [uncultured Pelagimonas sp.]
MSFAFAMVIALGLDALIGWPTWLFKRIGHPVTWIGALITVLESQWNDGSKFKRFALGSLTSIVTLAATLLATFLLTVWLPETWVGTVLTGVLAWPLIAARSMFTHVQDVARPLTLGDLPKARFAVSMIVGRDPSHLDEPGIARAALESLAENCSDGIVAPVFWGALFGLPGIAAYKAINTLDSMIGHHNDRYEFFGKFAARLDDVVNFLPSRLTGLLFALTSTKTRAALRCIRRDARHHRSPNAGWPEAALAGALGVRLSGPRVYGTTKSEEPFVNGTCPDPSSQDLGHGLRLFTIALLALALGLALWALV